MKTISQPLTRRQFDVLWIVENNGPVSVKDVDYHWRTSYSSAYGVLSRLEARGLVAATYTGHHRRENRAYVITGRGTEALAAAEYEPEDEDA